MTTYQVNYTLPGKASDRAVFEKREDLFIFIESLWLNGCTYLTLKAVPHG